MHTITKRSISKCIINWYLILIPIVWNFILKIHSIHDPNTLCIKTYRIVRLMKIFKTHKCPYKKDYIFCDIFKAKHHQCNSLLIDLNLSLSHPSLHSSSLSLSLSLSLSILVKQISYNSTFFSFDVSCIKTYISKCFIYHQAAYSSTYYYWFTLCFKQNTFQYCDVLAKILLSEKIKLLMYVWNT